MILHVCISWIVMVCVYVFLMMLNYCQTMYYVVVCSRTLTELYMHWSFVRDEPTLHICVQERSMCFLTLPWPPVHPPPTLERSRCRDVDLPWWMIMIYRTVVVSKNPLTLSTYSHMDQNLTTLTTTRALAPRWAKSWIFSWRPQICCQAQAFVGQNFVPFWGPALFAVEYGSSGCW